MSNFKECYTVMNNVEVKFEEKKSIFLCNIKRVENEEEAQSFIAEIKEKYKTATHNVYAYITNNSISMRYSDDGEPQGTAGPPVLEVLKREGLNDVVAVVTRYFGGTMLGAGGLIRAYGTSCKQGVDAAVKVLRVEGHELEIKINYEMYGKINNYFQGRNVIIKNVEYLEDVTLYIQCLASDFKSIKSDIIEMMSGEDIIEIISNEMFFVDGDKKLLR